MRHNALGTGFAVLFVASAIAISFGCNSILGNEEGTPRVVSSTTPQAGDAGAIRQSQSSICDVSLRGYKVCFGLCVQTDDPSTGCGATDCTACDPKNADNSVCEGTDAGFACSYKGCRAGYDSCDGDDANGCEASLASPDHCGDCKTKCLGEDVCGRPAAGAAYQCLSDCVEPDEKCERSCVDLNTSLEHCGACGNVCAREHATAKCVDRQCVFTCKPGHHACGEACKSNADPNACGAGCVVCPPGPPNTHPVCRTDACGTECNDGFLDCNGVAADGCEFVGNSCPLVENPPVEPAPLPGCCGGSTSGYPVPIETAGIRPQRACYCPQYQ